MNTTERIIYWFLPTIQLSGLVFLILTPKFKGKGLLLAFFVLTLTLIVGSHTGLTSMTTFKENEALWLTWQYIAETLSVDAQLLLLGSVVLMWMHGRSESTTTAEASLAGKAEQSVVCPKCQEPNEEGRTLCQKCSRSLQPNLFDYWTALSILGNVGWAAAGFFFPFVLQTVLTVIMALIMIGVNLAARRGWHWAWVFLQWSYGLSVVPLVIWAAKVGGIAWLITVPVAIAASLIIYYFNTRRVRAFCCVGRE